MALYYAPAVGSYLIGKCLHLGPKEGYLPDLLCAVAVATVIDHILFPRQHQTLRSPRSGHRRILRRSLPTLPSTILSSQCHHGSHHSYFPIQPWHFRGQGRQLLVRVKRPHEVEIQSLRCHARPHIHPTHRARIRASCSCGDSFLDAPGDIAKSTTVFDSCHRRGQGQRCQG